MSSRQPWARAYASEILGVGPFRRERIATGGMEARFIVLHEIELLAETGGVENASHRLPSSCDDGIAMRFGQTVVGECDGGADGLKMLDDVLVSGNWRCGVGADW